MRIAPLSRLLIALAFLIPILANAQTPDASNPTPGQIQSPQRTDRQITDWRITEKEVKAVQAELSRRGYYRSKITGVLDRETREAVRAFQSDNGLRDSGRIDLETYQKLELTYPATGNETDSMRRTGLAPKIGYGVKDATVSAGSAVTGGVKKVGSGIRAGLEKTWDAGDATVSKSKDLMRGAGEGTVKGAKGAARGAERAGNRLIGRSDAEVHEDVRRSLEENPETRHWYSDVKEGMVTVKTPQQHNADVGAVISNIRKVPGVKSVFVVVL